MMEDIFPKGYQQMKTMSFTYYDQKLYSIIKKRKDNDIAYYNEREDYQEIVTLTEYNPL